MPTNSSDPEFLRNLIKAGKLLAYALIFVLSFIFSYWVFLLCAFDDWETRGQFGDSFGAVSALFAGLAFILLMAGLYLQFLEISKAISELTKQTRIMNERARSEVIKNAGESRPSFEGKVDRLPLLSFKNHMTRIEGTLLNHGAIVHNLKVECLTHGYDKEAQLDNYSLSSGQSTIWRLDETAFSKIHTSNSPQIIHIRVSYLDSNESEGFFSYVFFRKEDSDWQEDAP